MNVKNLWVGIGRNAKINRILHLPGNSTLKRELIKSTLESYKGYHSIKTSIGKWSRKALILEETYYIDINAIDEMHTLSNIKEKIFSRDSLSSTNEVISFGRKKEQNLEKNDSLKFLLVELQDEIIFLLINSRKTIKKANIFNIFNKSEGVGIDSNIVEINSGIHIPERVTAVYDKVENRLYVLDVLGFENMLYIHEANKEKALEKYNKFVQGEYKLGTEKWMVEFDNSKLIKDEIIKSTRAVNRLAIYDNDSSYNIKQIRNAVNQLNNETSRVVFDDENNKVKVDVNNYKTFIGIIHNGIVKRLISGEVEVLL